MAQSIDQNQIPCAAALLITGASLLLFDSACSAGIVAVGAGSFGPGSTTVTFDEVAVGTTIPFSVGMASFVGLSGVTSNVDLGLGMTPAPSGSPYLYSGSVGNDDVIEVKFGVAQRSVGAYFNTFGDLLLSGALQLEFYDGDTLLGILAGIPDPGTLGGFVGGQADSAMITRVIFRDTDPDNPVSFRLDDLMFVPAPGCLGLLLPCLCLRRRRA